MTIRRISATLFARAARTYCSRQSPNRMPSTFARTTKFLLKHFQQTPRIVAENLLVPATRPVLGAVSVHQADDFAL
jgi:hypothetical protein